MSTKILLVDDEPFNLATLEAFLTGQNYELIFAETGIEACAKAHAEQPDLILLDVMMPEMDGFAVTRRIRSDPVVGRVPIILVTALDDDRSRLEGLQAGADDFLTKPCRRDELRARVRTVASLNRFRAIAEQRERFERLFELAPDAIVLVNGAEGRVLAANSRAIERQLRTSVFDAFSAEAGQVLRAVLTEALAGGTPRAREVTTGAHGAELIYQVRAVLVPDGEEKRVMMMFEDVTTEVRARETLRTLNLELERQVKMRTRQLEEANGLLLSYASFVSHDLRSPLTVIKGYLSMIQEGVVPLGPEAGPLVTRAYDAALTMQELIQNILQLAQDEHDRPRDDVRPATDPTPVVRRLATRLGDFSSGPPPRFEIADLPPVGVSAVLIERVFYNLIGNALKYSAQRPEPQVEIGAEGPVIFVRDNGIGFESRDAEKLFQEFSRLSTAQGTEGFGLGLSLVARLIRAHGGDIWAKSAVGAGATFFVRFPRPDVPLASPAGVTTVGDEA